MKKIFVFDEGISLWEQSKKVADRKFATITVIQRDIEALNVAWQSILPILLTIMPCVFRWFTTGSAFEKWIQSVIAGPR